MSHQPYKRLLLKLSGEQLAGSFEGGIDAELVAWMGKELKPIVAQGLQLVIMVGGGNYARGAQLAGNGIGRVTGDNMGMLATMMNAVAVADIFTSVGLESRALSIVKADQIVDQFTYRRAISHLKKGRVIICAGGTGRPFVTTDTAAISFGLELECEAVLKATKVDGVYDKDPAKFADAVKVAAMSFQEAVANDAIRVMDKAALGMAMENSLPVVVFNAMEPGNLLKLAHGEPVGTRIG